MARKRGHSIRVVPPGQEKGEWLEAKWFLSSPWPHDLASSQRNMDASLPSGRRERKLCQLFLGRQRLLLRAMPALHMQNKITETILVPTALCLLSCLRAWGTSLERRKNARIAHHHQQTPDWTACKSFCVPLDMCQPQSSQGCPTSECRKRWKALKSHALLRQPSLIRAENRSRLGFLRKTCLWVSMESCSRNIKSEWGCIGVKAQEEMSKRDKRVSGIDGTKVIQNTAHLWVAFQNRPTGKTKGSPKQRTA